jgi:segregation and condensation protein B
MHNVYTNGAPIVQAQFEIDLGDYYVESAGERVALTAALESLLFVATEPLTPAELAQVLPFTNQVIEEKLQQLARSYTEWGRGIRLQERNGAYLMVTMPSTAPLIERFLQLDLNTRLSKPALETLAVIAYRQPITRAQIEAVRGVDCAAVLRSLLQRELIEEMGRAEVAGRPFLYRVTDVFLHYFGLTSLDQLPALSTPDAEQMDALSQAGNPAALA